MEADQDSRVVTGHLEAIHETAELHHTELARYMAAGDDTECLIVIRGTTDIAAAECRPPSSKSQCRRTVRRSTVLRDKCGKIGPLASLLSPFFFLAID